MTLARASTVQSSGRLSSWRGNVQLPKHASRRMCPVQGHASNDTDRTSQPWLSTAVAGGAAALLLATSLPAVAANTPRLDISQGDVGKAERYINSKASKDVKQVQAGTFQDQFFKTDNQPQSGTQPLRPKPGDDSYLKTAKDELGRVADKVADKVFGEPGIVDRVQAGKGSTDSEGNKRDISYSRGKQFPSAPGKPRGKNWGFWRANEQSKRAAANNPERQVGPNNVTTRQAAETNGKPPLVFGNAKKLADPKLFRAAEEAQQASITRAFPNASPSSTKMPPVRAGRGVVKVAEEEANQIGNKGGQLLQRSNKNPVPDTVAYSPYRTTSLQKNVIFPGNDATFDPTKANFGPPPAAGQDISPKGIDADSAAELPGKMGARAIGKLDEATSQAKQSLQPIEVDRKAAGGN